MVEVNEQCLSPSALTTILPVTITKRVMANVFSSLASTQLDAFKDRAKTLYGESHA